jgi:CheY-like chemotaxis protein
VNVILHILVADDNADYASALAELIRERGHRVREAYDGPQALQIAAGFRPHVMILDIAMPGMCGHEVCDRVRAEPWARDILMVALSGRGDFEDKCQSRGVGFDYHVVKPAAFEQVIRLVERSDTHLAESSKLVRTGLGSQQPVGPRNHTQPQLRELL